MKHTKEKWKINDYIGITDLSLKTDEPVYWQNVISTKMFRTIIIAKCLSTDRDKLKANTKLMVEAGNVANETGCTPRQLTEQKAELLEALKRFTERKVESLDEIDCYIFHISDIKKAELAIKNAT